MPIQIQLSPYNPLWPNYFQEESQILSEYLTDAEIKHQLFHIGSSSIPGMTAKPVIDIILATPNLVNFQKIAPILSAYGYTNKGELNIPFRIFFSRKTPDVGYNLHLYEEDNPDINLNFTFRNYLIEHPDLLEEYMQIKKNLAQKSVTDPNTQGLNGYTLGKDTFIRRVLTEAEFDEPCIRFCSHYKEWDQIAHLQKQYCNNLPPLTADTLGNNLCFVFYRGMEIIGYAYWCEDDLLWSCREFVLTKPVFLNHFEGLCYKWFSWREYAHHPVEHVYLPIED